MSSTFSEAASLLREATTVSKETTTKKYAIEILVVVLVTILQYLCQSSAFHCPHGDSHFRYSIYVLFGAPILFYCLAILNNELLQYRIRGVARGCFTKGSRNQRMLRIKWKTVSWGIFLSCMRCLLAPMTWIIVSLLQKRFYVCATVGYEHLDLKGAANVTHHEALSTAGTHSQVFGMMCLLFPTLIYTVFSTIKRCFKNPVDDLPCLEVFTTYEAEVARNLFEEIIRNAANKNARSKIKQIMKSVEQEEQKDRVTTQMTYENMMAAREKLTKVYPIVEDRSNHKQRMMEAWESEIDIFQKTLLPRYRYTNLVAKRSVLDETDKNTGGGEHEKTSLL